MTFLIYPDPKWRADGNLQKAPLSWMCCLCVGLAHFHWPTHVHQHPFWCRVQHAEPSAFPVPHLPSGGRHHRGETHKEAHIRSQTLQTATKPWGHVARPAMALPGQEPAFHCAYEADTIPLNLLELTWSRRKVPTWGSQIKIGTRTEEKIPLHPKEIGVVLFDPQRQDKHLVLFSDTEEPRCQLIANTVYPVCLCAGRGLEEGKAARSCLMVPLPICRSPRWMLEPNGLSELGQSNRLWTYCTLLTILICSEVRMAVFTKSRIALLSCR